MTNVERIHRIADHFGEDAQSLQLAEECAELIQAIIKFRRAKGLGQTTVVDYKAALANLIEEIADVELMIEQVKYLLDIPVSDLIEIKINKINRTVDRMAK